MWIDNYTSYLKSYQDDPFSSSNCQSLLNRPKVLVLNLLFRRSWKMAKKGRIYNKVKMGRLMKREMEMKNLKLYMANKIIVDENEKLKKKASELLLENEILQSQLRTVKPKPGLCSLSQ